MTSFHVRHNFTPPLAREVLLLARGTPELSLQQLIEHAKSRDLELGRRGTADKVVASLRELGFLAHTGSTRDGSLQLTRLGSALLERTVRDRRLFAEFVHMRYWWLSVLADQTALYSWAYRFVSTLLWDNAPVTVDSDLVVASVLGAAERSFGVETVSFSTASVLGILHWLRALRPPVLMGSDFRRRYDCPPEATAIAVEAVGAASGYKLNAPLGLDSSAKLMMCQCLLLEPSALDEMLSLAVEAGVLVRRQSQGHEALWLRESVLPGLVAGERR